MKPIRLPLLLAAAALAPLSAHAANDYPTVERVLYVQACMKEHEGPHYELINKCSCALDRLAGELKHADYVTMNTIANAMSIGGERGNEMRDNESLKAPLKRWRELQAKARKSCFLDVASPR